MLRALEEHQLAGKVKFIGFDPGPELVVALRSGKMHGLVLQDPVRMACMAVTSMGPFSGWAGAVVSCSEDPEGAWAFCRVLRKRDLPFRRIFWLFGAFILACGTIPLASFFAERRVTARVREHRSPFATTG
jgi:hypothetical protein